MFHSKYNSGKFLNGGVYEVHIKYGVTWVIV